VAVPVNDFDQRRFPDRSPRSSSVVVGAIWKFEITPGTSSRRRAEWARNAGPGAPGTSGRLIAPLGATTSRRTTPIPLRRPQSPSVPTVKTE